MTENPVLLHDYWRSTASYRVRIALGLKGLDYKRVVVDLVSGAHREKAHQRLNPQGLVPVLEIDGHALTQSLAIIEYLEQTRPEPRLLPEEPAERARVRAIAMAIACEIHPVSNLSVLQRVEKLAGPDARGEWNRGNIRKGLEAIEVMLQQGRNGRFCSGDHPGLADCTLIPQLYNADRWGVDYSDLSRIKSVADSCSDIPAFAAAHPDRFDPSAA